MLASDVTDVDEVLIAVDGVTKIYHQRGNKDAGQVRAVNHLDLQLHRGETLSLVGESGCGKSTLAKMILGLTRPTEGHVLFRGRDVQQLDGGSLRDFRRGVQAVVQDPRSSLNPRKRIGWIVGEPLYVLRKMRGKELKQEVARLLTEVSLDPRLASSYPHELSGGMRQRVAIARALSINPDVIVLDEPVSALDVSVRAQIINLLRDIQDAHQVSYLMISHDLSTVGYLSDRIAVMYAGEIVEQGPAQQLLKDPQHPYTDALLKAARIETVKGLAIEDINTASPETVGCCFVGRCPVALEQCATVVPIATSVVHGGLARCHLLTPAVDRPQPTVQDAPVARPA